MRIDLSARWAFSLSAWLLIGALLASCASQPLPAPGPQLTPFLENPTLTPLPSVPVPTAGSTPVPPAPASAGTALPGSFTGFYHLRVELTTTSDWTSLTVARPDEFLTARVVSTTGTAKTLRVTPSEIYLSQAQDAAKSGASVGVTADLALGAPLASPSIPLVLKRGGIPATTLLISLVQGSAVTPLLQTRHAAHVPGDSASNALPVSLNLASIGQAQPQPLTVSRPDVPHMLWAFYYLWYHSADWNNAQLRDHPLATYLSSDPAVIARQIDQAKSAGIDGFIASWWGPGSYPDQNLKVLLKIAAQKHFKVMIYFETLAASGPLPAEDIYRWLDYAISTYQGDPAYMKWDGKPVIAFYNSGQVPLPTWKDIFSRLRAQGLDSANLAMGLDAGSLDVFDGFHLYGIVTTPDLTQAFSQAGQAAHAFSLLADGAGPKLWAATVQPGYDERLIPGRAGLVQDRANGDFYRAAFAAALQSSPDWIFITSWNEWWENTYIEPGKLYGDQYLQLTRQFGDQWKSGP